MNFREKATKNQLSRKLLALLLALAVACSSMGLAGCANDKFDTLLKAVDSEFVDQPSGSGTSNETGDSNDSSSGDTFLVRADGSFSNGSPYTSEKASRLVFRSKKLLEEHYEKHGIEMGFANSHDYQAAAAAVVANPCALHKLEAEDGDDVYYLETTNELVIVSTDGYLRTYFCPDSGKRYFDRQ